MRIVAALGGNALLRRGQRPDADVQERNAAAAAEAVAELARGHELVVTHGNGPQVGVLALESAADPALTRPYPLEALVAETQGLIGYWLLQDLHNALPGRSVVALLTRTLVDLHDPAFAAPTKFVGPMYDQPSALALARDRGWSVAADGDGWRRVVASPEPECVLESGSIELLVAAGTVVVCGGGGGIPVARREDGSLHGVAAVVDKDLTAAVLAEDLGAGALLLLTDVAAVEVDHGTDHARPIGRTTVDELRRFEFAPGSMGPKVEAACRFVERTGGVAAIGSIIDVSRLLTGDAGTLVTR